MIVGKALSIARPEPWMVDAACVGTDPEAFFPEKGQVSKEAKKVCLGCPVTLDCLAYALRNGERFGLWGGLSERERRRLKYTGRNAA